MSTRIPPVVVADGQVHENILTGDAIDTSKLPICKYSPDDGGRYITAGIVVSKDPETGVPDIGNYRFEVVDKQTLTFLALPNHRFGRNLAKARRQGQKNLSRRAADWGGSGHGLYLPDPSARWDKRF
jgi:4-hydroxy-3-polyprenylbenzoate decarboxylase/2,5-furandicarboxylate decarboxylase 1